MAEEELYIFRHAIEGRVIMAKPLIIFVGSPNVGPYINVMANSVQNHDVDSIALINVLESPSGQQVDFADFANRVLWDTMSNLVEGKYTDRGKELAVPKDCEAYKKLKQVFGNSHFLHTVNYQFLRDGIEKLRNRYGADAIVDVSSVPKRVAIDILTASLAAGMPNIMLFELKKPMSGIQALYHSLKETDYEHVVLPNWEPLLGNLEFFSARQNRRKLWTVVASIVISLLLTILYQLGRITFGDGSWFVVGAIVLFGFFGGILPIVDAWGGIRLGMVLSGKKH
jgi:hypothetical protein